MMALIGFLVLALLGMSLLIVGLLALRFFALMSPVFPWECLIMPAIGLALLYIAWVNAPFTINLILETQ